MDTTSQQAGQRTAEQAISMMEIACRGTALLFDIQMQAARNVLEAQARAATLFGAPDCSGLFRMPDDKSKMLCTSATEQMLRSTRQANDAVVQMNQQLSQLMEQQAGEMSDGIRRSFEELGRQTQQGIDQVRHTVEEGARQAERAGTHVIQTTGEMTTPPRAQEQKRPGARPS